MSGLAMSDIADIAFTNKIGERTNGLFNGSVGIDAVFDSKGRSFRRQDAVGSLR